MQGCQKASATKLGANMLALAREVKRTHSTAYFSATKELTVAEEGVSRFIWAARKGDAWPSILDELANAMTSSSEYVCSILF